MSLGEAFEVLGQAVESVGIARHKLWVLAHLSNDPAHRSLADSLNQVDVAIVEAYNELVRDPSMPYRGEKAIAEYCRRRGYSNDIVEAGLEYLVRWWELTVGEVKSGYKGIVDEYINALNGRRIIHEVWPLTSAEEQSLYGPRLEEADERFVAATEVVERSFARGVRTHPGRYPAGIRWLYYRVPKKRDSNWSW